MFAQSASAYNHADRVEIRAIAVQGYQAISQQDWAAACDTLTPWTRTTLIKGYNTEFGKKHFKTCKSTYKHMWSTMNSSDRKEWRTGTAKMLSKLRHSKLHIEFRRSHLGKGVDAEVSIAGTQVTENIPLSKVNGTWLIGQQIGKPHYTG